MTEAFPLIAGLICFVLLFFLFRKRRKAKTGSGNIRNTVTPHVIRVSPPPLPVRNNRVIPSFLPAQQVLDYPKCPIDRCRNEPGKPQVVFWDNTQKCYTCCHGHRFTGRE